MFPYKISEFPAGNREKSGKGKTAKSKKGNAVRIYRNFQEQFVLKQVTSHLLSSSVGFYSIGFKRGGEGRWRNLLYTFVSVVDPHWHQCDSGSSFLPLMRIRIREPRSQTNEDSCGSGSGQTLSGLPLPKVEFFYMKNIV